MPRSSRRSGKKSARKRSSRSRSRSGKKSLAVLIRQIAKKNNIVLPGQSVRAPAPRVGAPMLNVMPLHQDANVPQVRISAPADRPCGKNAKGEDRYTREELIELARAQGVNTKQNMDLLCKALGINPRAAGGVMIEQKDCGTKARGDNRYTREDLELLAVARNIPVKGRSMDALCADLGLHHVAPHGSEAVPRGAILSGRDIIPPVATQRRRSVSPPRVVAPLPRQGSFLQSGPQRAPSMSSMFAPSESQQMAIDQFLSPSMM